MKMLQKFSAIHASVQNYLNQERHLVSHEQCKQDRAAALAEWRTLVA
jgi:putative transposase